MATATVFGITVSASGLRGGGWVTLVTALVGFMILLDPRWASRAGWLYARRRGLWSALLWISVIVCGLNLFSVESYGLAGVVQPGWGLYPAFFASLGGLAADWVLRSQARVSSATRS